MRITTRGRYALRAVLALANLSRGNVLVSISTLSETEDISPIFLEQIFFKLKKAGIVSSVRGPNGGFILAKPAENINVKEILDASGEEMDSGYCDKHSDSCERQDDCISHRVWDAIADMVNNYLRGITLASLMENKRS